MSIVVPEITITASSEIPTISIDDLPLVPKAPTGVVVEDAKGNGVINGESTIIINNGDTSEATSVREFVHSSSYASYGDTDKRMEIVSESLMVAPQWKPASHYTSKIHAAAKKVK